MMKCLTVLQPYAGAIASTLPTRKGLENRDWVPSEKLLKQGELLAISAGKRVMVEDEVLDVFVDLYGKAQPELLLGFANKLVAEAGKVLCVVRFDGFVSCRDDAENAGQGRWWVGDHGWLLPLVKSLATPIECRGQQGLWTLPEDVERQVRAQL